MSAKTICNLFRPIYKINRTVGTFTGYHSELTDSLLLSPNLIPYCFEWFQCALNGSMNTARSSCTRAASTSTTNTHWKSALVWFHPAVPSRSLYSVSRLFFMCCIFATVIYFSTFWARIRPGVPVPVRPQRAWLTPTRHLFWSHLSGHSFKELKSTNIRISIILIMFYMYFP